MKERLEQRLAELQQLAQQHQSVLLQITGAIQEVQNLLKEQNDASEARNQQSNQAS